MIIFLYGSDGYRLRESADDIISKYKKKHTSGFNFFSIDCQDTPVSRIADISKETSFFDEVKLVRIKNVWRQAVQLEEIINKHGLLNDKTITLLIIEENTKKVLESSAKSLFKLLNTASSLVREFEPPTGQKLANWIVAKCKERSVLITSDAVRTLITTRGGDIWGLSGEIDKLTAYCRSSTIKASHIAELVVSEQGINIFELTDAVAGQDKAKTFSLLHKALAIGQDPGYLLAMITYQFRNLLTVVDLISRSISVPDITKKSGLHPFVVKKIAAAARNLNSEKLTAKYKTLLDIDTNFKEGRIDLIDSLYSFVFNV